MSALDEIMQRHWRERVNCAEHGCDQRLRVDPKHAENVRASQWRCRTHRTEAA